MNKNKIGLFIIKNKLLHDDSYHEMLMRLMGRMIIIRAEQMFIEDGIEYTAISDYFDEIEHGALINNYDFEISKSEIKPIKRR